MASNTAGGNPVVVKFSGSQVPSVTSAGHTGSVVLVNASLNPQPNSDLRKYRLTLHNATFDFTNTKDSSHASDAAGTEHLRPAHFDATAGPLLTTTSSTRCRRRSSSPPAKINWTALPDATGRARGVLSWPAGDNATGYFIWESTEVALRYIIDPAQADPPAGTKMLDRAQALKTLVDNNQDKSLGAVGPA